MHQLKNFSYIIIKLINLEIITNKSTTHHNAQLDFMATWLTSRVNLPGLQGSSPCLFSQQIFPLTFSLFNLKCAVLHQCCRYLLTQFYLCLFIYHPLNSSLLSDYFDMNFLTFDLSLCLLIAIQ